MAAIYVPEGSLTDAAKYDNPYYAAPQTPPPPFLPPPYSPPPLSDDVQASDTSKADFDVNVLLWPDNPPPYEGAEAPFAVPRPLATRRRTMSLHGPAASPPPWSTGDSNNSAPTIPIPIQVHPFLDGDTPSPIFFFDVAPLVFAPLRCVSMNPPRGMVLAMTEFRKPAFHPPLTSLRLLHPKLPSWPIDLALPKDIPAAEAPPISLGDILVCIHRALHTRITHADWETLSEEDKVSVASAYTKRCRAEAARSQLPLAQLRDREIEERNQGVKRVDFLLGKTVFQGLVKSPQDPEGYLRMVFGARHGPIGGPPTADISMFITWPPKSSRQHSLTSATRPRAISWHGPEAPSALEHTRSKSPPLPSTAYSSHANTHWVHPFLNGDVPSPIFFFDVAPLHFAPLKCVAGNPSQSAPLSEGELRESAFDPPLTSMRLLHPKLPFWPIDLALPEDMDPAQASPISLGDILVGIHKALHMRMMHADMETLSEEDKFSIFSAFTQRCRAEAVRSKVPLAQLKERETEERNLGVMRVDFLLGQTVFKGLVKSPQDPEGCLRMVFGTREGQIGGPPTANISMFITWPPKSSRQHSLTSATRPRAISWHGPEAPSARGHTRSKSSPLPSTAYPSYTNTHWVHPFLNGDVPSPIFFFDVAPLHFAPVKCVSVNPPQSAPLSEGELRESAFDPPLTSLRLLHPKLPFWPIDLGLPDDMAPAQASPISLGDILVGIHKALHTRITHADWETLSEEDRVSVASAYTKRCRAEAVRSKVPLAQLKERETEERNLGVMRVDFLLGQTVFKGLVKSPQDPEGCLRMVFGDGEVGGEGSPLRRLSDSNLEKTSASDSNLHPTFTLSPEETPVADSNLEVSANSVPTSSVSASDNPETQADTAQISTFVIWSPKSPRQHYQTSALNTEDIQTLRDDFAEGGTIISSHHPDDVVLWLEANYDHPLLQTMRTRGVGGPLPTMLSPEEPSLVVFGSIRDGWVVDAAEVLSELSNFAVMIRPLRDNPVPNWEKDFSFAEDPVSGENQAREDSLPDNSDDWTSLDHDDEGTDESDNDGSTTTEDSATAGSDPSGIFRLRGGASRDFYGPWIGPLHKVDVRLDICPREGVSYNVDLLTRLQTQSKYESKYQRDNVVSYHGHRAQIISKTEFSVVPREGAPVKADRSYSTIGFLVEGQDITDCRWLESPDFSPPRQITKTVDSQAKAKTFTIGATVSAQPEGTLSYGTTSTKTNTMENQNNKVTPKCRIESWAGKRLEKNQIFYDSFEIAYEAGDDLNKREVGAKYPMEVEFSMGINVADLENMADSHLPNTSFLILNQTNLWIYRSDLKTKGQGILVLTVAHIPDVAAINELRVVENQTVNLEGTSVINVPTNSPPINNPVNTSLSISAILDAKPDKKPQHLLTKLKRAAKSLRSQKTIPLRPEIETLPMHEFISRGWDARLNEWRKVMYPSLTSAFQRVSKSSDIAVWRLEVGDFSKGKQCDSVDPTTGLDETSAPPRASFTTASDSAGSSQDAATASTSDTSLDTHAGADPVSLIEGKQNERITGTSNPLK